MLNCTHQNKYLLTMLHDQYLISTKGTYTYRDASGKLVLGDILTGINGKAIKLQKDLFAALDDLRPGDKVDLDLVREGKQEQVSVTLGERADPSATASATIGPD